MKSTDRQRFVEVLLAFAELKGKQLSAPAIELYWRVMQEWDIDVFCRAAEHLLRTCAWFPEPHHFEELRAAARATTGEAWARVLQHSKGAYRSGVGLDDGGPIDQAVAALGGYKAVGFYDRDYLGVLERRFAEHYEVAIDVGETRAGLPELATLAAPKLTLLIEGGREGRR